MLLVKRCSRASSATSLGARALLLPAAGGLGVDRLAADRRKPSVGLRFQPNTGASDEPQHPVLQLSDNRVAARWHAAQAQQPAGRAKAQAHCVAHCSAEHMAYQPLNASWGYWDAMVHRMKTMFKAPVKERG